MFLCVRFLSAPVPDMCTMRLVFQSLPIHSSAHLHSHYQKSTSLSPPTFVAIHEHNHPSRTFASLIPPPPPLPFDPMFDDDDDDDDAPVVCLLTSVYFLLSAVQYSIYDHAA